MKFYKNGAQLFIPDGTSPSTALSRTTSLCIAAHQDDMEIMAYNAIAECYESESKWFTGVVVTDGSGSPRNGAYENYSDEEMKAIRIVEQENAAKLGKYSAQLLLSYTSNEAKQSNPPLVDELAQIIEKCDPDVLYTHNLADKHDTHVAVVLKTIRALRKVPQDKRPKKVFSMEAWRSLDWLCDSDKKIFDSSLYPQLAKDILKVFDSQIEGGKQYDLAAFGRRLANATFLESHAVDSYDSAIYSMDITPLMENEELLPSELVNMYIDNFKKDVFTRINKYF